MNSDPNLFKSSVFPDEGRPPGMTKSVPYEAFNVTTSGQVDFWRQARSLPCGMAVVGGGQIAPGGPLPTEQETTQKGVCTLTCKLKPESGLDLTLLYVPCSLDSRGAKQAVPTGIRDTPTF